jgi:hypothetical protein
MTDIVPDTSTAGRRGTLDWSRIERWTADILADDLRSIGTAFVSHGVGAPKILWRPGASDLTAAPLKFLVAHWAGLGGEGKLPHIGQIDPFGLRPALGYVILVDAVDEGRDFRYRLYGSIVAQISDFDMTGKLLSEIRASAHVAEFGIAVYRASLRQRAAIFSERQPLGSVQTMSWQRLALPLVDDSGSVVRFLVGTVPLASDGHIIGI